MSAGEPLISMRPLRCNEVLDLAGVEIFPLSLRLQTLLYWILIQWCIPPSSRRFLTIQHTKYTKLQNPSVPNNMGRLHKCAGMSAYGHSSGECNGWPVSRQETLDTTKVIRPRGAWWHCAWVENFRAEMLLFRSPHSGNDVTGLFIKQNEGQNINQRLKLETKETDSIFIYFLIFFHRRG